MYKVKVALLSLFLSVFMATSFIASAASQESAKQGAAELAIDKQKPFGDAEAGKGKVATCGACHGRDGNSGIAANPKLAGQGAKYLYKQMKDFQSGARQNPIMQAQLSGYSDQDLKNIAAYYAQQEVVSGTVKKEFLELGQKIYRAGNAETGLPACIACHGPAGKGMAGAGFPALAGQHAQYTEKQLKAFRSAGRGDHDGKKRSNDSVDGGAAMMQDVAAKMSDDEIQAVASYINGLR